MYVDPPKLVLQGGATARLLSAISISGYGSRTRLPADQLTFRSLNPALVDVSPDGTVSARGFGSGWVEVTQRSTGLQQRVLVQAGQLRLHPPYLRLSLANPTARLRAIAENADGSPLSLVGHEVRFTSSADGSPNPTASVSPDGAVIALRPALERGDLIFVQLSVDGEPANNSAIVRVAQAFADIPFAEYASGPLVFDYAPKIKNLDVRAVLESFSAARWTELAYKTEETLAGYPTFRDGVRYLVNEVGGSANVDDPTIPCGGSGNPTQLGTNPAKSIHNSCLIVAAPPYHPQWFIFFHEMGHDITGQSMRFDNFVKAGSDALLTPYAEGLASAAALFTGDVMRRQAGPDQLPIHVQQSMEWQGVFPGMPRWADALNEYVAGGACYAALNPDVMDGIISQLMVENGIEWYFRFSSVFLPNTQPYDFEISGYSQQATFFAAAVSAAVGRDLRTRFSSWGFPIDNAYYDQISPELRRLVSQRPDPLIDQRVAVRTVANAASYTAGTVAPATWVSIYGENLASTTVIATGLPSAGLAATKVWIVASDGVEHPVLLQYVSPGAINLLLPSTAPVGPARIRVRNAFAEAYASISLSPVAPGLFSANSDGQGPAAATWLRISGSGGRTEGYTFTTASDSGKRANDPIDLGADGDTVYLSLYGTGFRDAQTATARIAGVSVPVYGWIAHPVYPGLDQIVIGPLPRTLTANAPALIETTFDGIVANAVTVRFR